MRPAAVDVTVLSTGHDVADARLHRLVNVLAEREGLTVEVHGLGEATDGPPEAEVHTRPRRGMLRRALDAVTLPWRSRGRVVLVLDPDLVVPALLRRSVARRPAGPATAQLLVVDVHEDYALVLRDRSWARGPRLQAARLLVAAATGAARRADLTVVADDHLPPSSARRRLVLQNLPLPTLLTAAGQPSPELRALYVGDVRRSRGLRTMLAVMEATPEWSLDVVGPVAAADRPWLDRWRSSSPARTRVRFHGRRPPRQAWELARGARVGLSLLQPTPAFRAALPTKVLEYLSCGLAVLTTPLPRSSALVNDTGSGVVVGDVGSAAAALRRWAAEPGRVRCHQAAALRWAERSGSDHRQYAEFGDLVSELARRGSP